MQPNNACANCGAPMAGEFCAACGQKRFRAEDRRFVRLAAETAGTLTDLDSRLWRSLRALMLEPGRIARDWFDGRRAAWISPIRLFLLANLIYFIAPVLTDLSLPLHNQVRGSTYREFAPELCGRPGKAWKCDGGQPHSALTEPAFLQAVRRERAAAAARGEAFVPAEFEQRYGARSDAIGKALVILHVPFVAAMLALLARRRHRYYAEHFVVALGLVTFALMFMQLVANPLVWLYAAASRALGGLPQAGVAVIGYGALAVFIAHFSLACRRCYDSGGAVALLQGLLALLTLAATSLFVYRPVQFLLALWTM